eukprot:3932632-Rhodomonas_salina.1
MMVSAGVTEGPESVPGYRVPGYPGPSCPALSAKGPDPGRIPIVRFLRVAGGRRLGVQWEHSGISSIVILVRFNGQLDCTGHEESCSKLPVY